MTIPDSPPPLSPPPLHPSDEEAVGWCGVGFSSEEATAGTIGTESTYPACLYSCGDNPACAAVRWVVATGQCNLMSECPVDNTDSNWRYRRFYRPPPPPEPPEPPEPPSPPFPPRSPPEPPARPAFATVGDDPIFVGGDGRSYEVRGDAGAFFNLLSAAALSVNAQFLRVPEQFRAEDVTDTVLGDVSISMCAGGCEARVTVNVTTGAVRQNALPLADGDAAACGLSVKEEAYVCDLRSMECTWRPAEEAATLLPLLPLGHTRLTVRGAGVRLMLTRHAMTDLDGEVDCSRVSAWPAASAACDRLSRGGHASDDAARLSLLLRSAMDAPVRRFYFMELGVASLGSMVEQAELHGLLGQRALLVAPAADMLPPPRADEPAAIAIGVGAPGGTHALVGDVGSQGEGAIEGVYTDYEVVGLHDHGGFRFSRWQGCGSQVATPA